MIYDAICNVVEFSSKDGYLYKGLLFKSGDSRITVIHVHGSCGNFLSFTALPDLAKVYNEKGINLLTFNLKAHDCIAEGNWKDGKFDYVGGSKVQFEECYIDIDSAIDFCYEFSDKIFLQGHSMGCERVVCYQIQRKIMYDTILISPCDGYALQEKYIAPESIEDQIKRLERNDETPDALILSEYGIRMDKEYYDIPMFRTPLLSILKCNAMKVFNIKHPITYYLDCKCICSIGELDTLQVFRAKEMFEALRTHFKEFAGQTFLDDHEFQKYGSELGNVLSIWIKDCIATN